MALTRDFTYKHLLVNIHRPGTILDKYRTDNRVRDLGYRLYYIAYQSCFLERVVPGVLHQQPRLETQEIFFVLTNEVLYLLGRMGFGK